MPFEASGAAGSGLGMATLRVEPDQILRLRARLEAVRERVQAFLFDMSDDLVVLPLGADPVSAETARVFNENANTATTTAQGFHEELRRVIDALDRVAQQYRLVDDSHAQVYERAGE